MSTALDEYKKHYGTELDGETVLKHAQFGCFKDIVTNSSITADKLREMGITAEMSRGQIIDCLNDHLETFGKEVVLLYRYGLQRIIDFCSDEVIFSNEEKPVNPRRNTEPPLMEKVHSKIVDPLIDAIMRRLYTGKWRKQKRE